MGRQTRWAWRESWSGLETGSRRWDLNPRPAVYETAALPLSYAGDCETRYHRHSWVTSTLTPALLYLTLAPLVNVPACLSTQIGGDEIDRSGVVDYDDATGVCVE